MSKYTRKQRPTEDEFIGFWHKAYTKAEPYARAIAITIGSALVVFFAVWGTSTWLEHKAQMATEAFGRAVRIYDADLITDEAPAKTDEENPLPRFKTEKERAEATLAELDQFDKKFHSSQAAKEAQLLRAGVLYDLHRYDDAATLYGNFLREPHANALTAIAREGLGLVEEARGHLDEALAAFQALEPKSGDFYRDRALWDEARIYQKKGDKQKAAERLKELIAKVPSSPLRDEAQTRVAALEGT
jgi:predicted negative regulator of RcsB-dependent stress response